MLPQIQTMANNQTIVITDDGKFFYSYDKFIAQKKDGVLYVTPLWDYNATTLKYFKAAFGLYLTKKEIQKLIDEGEIKIL